MGDSEEDSRKDSERENQGYEGSGMAGGGWFPGGGAQNVEQIAVSVVVPVYSGEAYLERLVHELGGLRAQWSAEGAPLSIAELLLVDDSAVDGSPDLMDRLAGEEGWVASLHLGRNFGQHAATVAGILHSAGDWVVTLDEDLQHPPGRIADLLRRVAETSSDVVYARPTGEIHETVFRDITSRGYKRAMEWLTRNPNVRMFNSFRLIRGSVARAASSVCTHDTYFDVALSWFTERVEMVSMELKDQRYISTGSSGYGLWTLLSHARRLFVSSHFKVLRLGALFGLAVVALSVVGGASLLVTKLVAPSAIVVRGWTSLMLTIMFFGGFVILLVGIMLEYLSMLVLRAQGKPLFFTIDRTSDKAIWQYFKGGAA